MEMNEIRQVAPTLDGIREDHVERYRWAAGVLADQQGRTVLDLGCGVGYGAYLMAVEAGAKVAAVDRDRVAIEYAREHYAHDGVTFYHRDIQDLSTGQLEMITAFEIIEHTPAALEVLALLPVKVLVGSVPNELENPFVEGRGNPEHYRHFTPGQITGELLKAGWNVTRLGYQVGKEGDEAAVDFEADSGRTIVFQAER